MEIETQNRFFVGFWIKFVCIIAAWLSLSLFGPAQAYDEYQYEMLLYPTVEMLEAESRGYIMIYDGLENRTVEMALTKHFDRIESMMFVGTRYLQDDGEVMFEEEGCD